MVLVGDTVTARVPPVPGSRARHRIVQGVVRAEKSDRRGRRYLLVVDAEAAWHTVFDEWIVEVRRGGEVVWRRRRAPGGRPSRG